MDVRAVGVAFAFVLAVIAGAAVGWWHGSSPPETTAAAATAPHAGAVGDAEPADGVTAAPSPVGQAYDGKAFGVGDSVLAGAARCLAKRGVKVDAHESRQIDAGLDVLRKKAKDLPPRVLVHLGTNGGATASDLDSIMTVLGPNRLVVWSTIQLPDDPSRYTYEASTNEAIAALPQRYDNVRIFDWNAITTQQPSWIYGEGIHMTPEGCQGYADLVSGLLRAPSPFGNAD